MKIFPKPLSFKPSAGSFPLVKMTICNEDFSSAADYLSTITQRKHGFCFTPSKNGEVTFKKEEMGEGEYRIYVNEVGATLFAGDAQGAIFASATLLQMIEKTKDGYSICHGEVVDRPYMSVRAVHMYLPSEENIPAFLRILDTMAAVKMNGVIIEVGGGMEYERHPEINEGWKKFCRQARDKFPGVNRSYSLQWADKYWKDSVHTELAGGECLTKEQVRIIVEYEKSLGMNVIPEIQALSHSYYLTMSHRDIAELQDDPFPDSYCPSNEDSYRLYFDVSEEVLEVFKPSIVSVGHDEVRILAQCDKCKEKSGHELLAYELCRLHEFYTKRGITMAMWGEKLQNFKSFRGGRAGGVEEQRINDYGAYYHLPATHEAIDMIPTDILMLDWYHSIGKTSQDDFTHRGIKMIYGNFHGALFGEWDERSKKQGVLGAEVSTWCHTDEKTFAFDGVAYEIIYSAAVLWEQDYCNEKRAEMRQKTLDFMPFVKAILHGNAKPSDSGNAKLLWTPLETESLEACINIPKVNLPDTPTARMLSEFPETVFGVSVDTAKLLIECDVYAKSLLFLAAAKEEMPYIPSYRFPQMKQWELGTAAIFYEDGSVELANNVYGTTLGCLNYDFGNGRASKAGDEIDSGIGEVEVELSPYFSDNMPWFGSLAYNTTMLCDGKTAAFAYEWENPHPEKKIVKIKAINACQTKPQSIVLFGILNIN